jgi:hypothetical protein
VRRIWWQSGSDDAMIDVLKALNPLGSYPSHPHLREQTGRMCIGGSSKIARTAEAVLHPLHAGLFGPPPA